MILCRCSYDGDIIKIDIPNYKLEVELNQEEIEQRLALLPRMSQRLKLVP